MRRIVLFLLLFLPCAAMAAGPASVDPGRVQDLFAPARPTPAPFTPAPKPQAPTAVAPEGADKITFTLSAVTVDGMTVYKPADITPLYEKMIGKTVSFADLYTLATALTAKYRNDGYILSQVIVPPQEIENGRVHLRAVEGFVDNVSIKGGDATRLLPYVALIKKSRPLNNRDLERATLLVNDIPGLSAEAVLGPSSTTPGAADLTLVVKQRAYDGYAVTDNRGSRYMGPLQVSGGVTINNALGHFESIGLQFAGTPESWPRRQLSSAGVTWTQPLNARGTRLSVSGNITETRPGLSLAQFEDHGVARSASVGVSHPVIRSRRTNISAAVKFDWLDSQRSDNLGGAETVDRTRVLRAGVTSQFSDPWRGSNALNLEVSKGLGILNATRKGEANITRADGDPQFFKGTFSLTRVQAITGPWQISTAFTGQRSAHLLLASEEFGVGGAQFGSSYDASELTGEDGVAARAELQRTVQSPLQGLQVYGFYDIGKIWNRDDATPASRELSLADVGVGLRSAINERIFATFEIAKPLTRDVAVTGNREARMFFALSARF